MFSVRIVDADFYVTKPATELDILYSEFRQSKVTRVPVLRIFGSTPSGQKTCLHIHQVFPYIFVPYDGTQPCDKYLKQFATSVDFAVQVALGKATSNTNHVYRTEIVKGIPFYGYHEDEQEFIKIQFYNPRIVAKVVDLFQNGAILNKIFQPYESHIPYILQFLMDFNLYGMNLLHARKVCFRGWSRIENKDSQSQIASPLTHASSCSPNGSSGSFHGNATSLQHWNESTIPSDLRLDVAKTSRCELEVDVIAEDILNQLEIGTSIGRNPGITAMWEDERQRKRDHGQSSQISIPVSQDRGEMQLVDSELKFKRRIREIIQERNEVIRSQLEIMENSLSPEEFQKLSQSILLDGKEPSSQSRISQDVDENIPVVDESVIEDVLQASQSQPNSMSGEVDEEIFAILMSLAKDPNDSAPQECSPTANTSQMVVSEDKQTASDGENEEEESIIMSQPVWDDDDLIEDGGSRSQSDADEGDWKPQRIPQLDGPAGDDTPLLSNRSNTVETEECDSSPDLPSTRIRTEEALIRRLPQLDGSHDNDDDDGKETTYKKKIPGQKRLTSNVDNKKSSKRKQTTVHETTVKSHQTEADDDDFRTRKSKKPKIPGKTKDSLISKKKRQVATRQRRTAIAQLTVRGGNLKERDKPSHDCMASLSEVTTNSKRHLLFSSGGETLDRKDRKFWSNLEILHQSSKPGAADKESLEWSKAGGGSLIKYKNRETTWSENKTTSSEAVTTTKSSISKKDNLLHLDAESSGSQTSDFELRLSDSSSDEKDFKSKKKIPRITKEPQKLESFCVAKQAPVEIINDCTEDDSFSDKQSEERNTEILDKGTQQKVSSLKSQIIPENKRGFQRKKNKFNSRNQKEISKKIKWKSHVSSSAEQRYEVGEAFSISPKHSEKRTECSNLESPKRKRTRSKKVNCLKFTHVENEFRTDKSSVSNTDKCPISENCRFPETTNSKREVHSGLPEFPRRSFTPVNECLRNSEYPRNAECPRNPGSDTEVKKETRILFDACIRLEKISVKKLKSRNNTGKVFVEDLLEKVKDDFISSKDSLLDNELGADSLYQMAMLSPTASVGSDVESPPHPSSPSLNAISDDQSEDDFILRLPSETITFENDARENKSFSKKQIPRTSLVASLNADENITCPVIKLSHDKQDTLVKDLGMDESHPSSQTIEDYPIKFVSEKDVKVRGCGSKQLVLKDFNSAFANSCNVDEKSLDSVTQHKTFSNNESATEKLCMKSSMPKKEVPTYKKDFDTKNETQSSECAAVDRDIVKDETSHVDVQVLTRDSPVEALQDKDCVRTPECTGVIEDTSVSPGISVVCDSLCVDDDAGSDMDLLEQEREVGICKDMDAVTSALSAVWDDSFRRDEKLAGMDVEELMPEIENLCAIESDVSSEETNIDLQEIPENDITSVLVLEDGRNLSPSLVKVSESPRILEDRGLSEELDVHLHEKVEGGGATVFESGRSSGESKLCFHDMMKDSDGSRGFEEQGSLETNVDIHAIRDTESSRRGSCEEPTTQTYHRSGKSDHLKIWRPSTEPPSPSYVLQTRGVYGLPHERHHKAFCSDPKDLPTAARVVGGRRLQVSSLSVDELAEFDLGGNFQTLRELRGKMGSDMDNSLVRDCMRTLGKHGDDSDGYMDIPRELKAALIGEQEVVITPVRLPPSPEDVLKWVKSNPREPEMEIQGSEVNTFPDQVEVPNTPKDGAFENSPKSIHFIHSSTHSSTLADRADNLREISQPTQDESQNIPRDVLIVPQHSTPVANPGIKSRKLLQCTPIACGDFNEKISIDEKSCKITSLRRNILNSQVKERDSQDYHQPSPGEASYIEGPTPTNSFGFKISQPNIQVAKSVRQVQYLTLLSVELHVRTRKTLRPDPEFDAICAIFYHVEHETQRGKEYLTGVIVVRNESTKLRKPDDAGTSSSSVSGVNTTSATGIPQDGTPADRAAHEDTLLRNAGISNEINVITENEETDAINRFIKLVHEWDPDILLGFEVQMLSWGYLIQRATALGIDLAPQLSRVQDSSGTARFDAEKDQWGASHTSEISIAGRIMLNVWRLMRHEVTLNVYSFENISYHVLHERIPLYTFRQLTRWWDQKLPHERWRTVDHYVIRCQGNIKILNHVDFINRTSEFARLYGILFYSVISRGSQFRVESMMLRLTKPMNYLAVSPSIQQRARMDAPECIALVMEPESRFYTDPVIVLDFQSLYPSMIIAYNYCFSTCLGKVSRLDKIGRFDFGCTSLNVPPALLEKLEDDNDIHVSANGAAFVKSSVRRGILPRMLEEILDTRVMVKKAMKEHKNDKVLGQLLHARQLALKLIANVTYGYTSANFSGRMPCVEIADAIVRKARETLERAIHLVNSTEEWGARVVYGDTDSLFVLVKGATKEEAFKIGKEIVDAVTAENPKPVKLKFEKVYLPCVLQTKKRYVGYMYETLDQKEPVFDAKGIETVRRDTCPAVAKILEKSLRILFEEKDISLVKTFVQRQFRKLMEERVSLQDFIFAKEYRGMKGYRPTACVPALELARRMLSRDRRSEPRVGERVPYVVVNGSPGLPLIQLVRSPGDVLEDPSLRLNSTYYINKQILPPLKRVFSLIGIDVFIWYIELPRFVPRRHVATGKQKSSISRFFTTLHCPVCEQLTQQGLCHSCRGNPQKAVTILAERVGNWERKYAHLTEICFQCCGTRNNDIPCISLDCPVMFKRIKMKRKLEYGETLRDVQKAIEVTNT